MTTYTQVRRTKLGLATITIRQEGDLHEATLKMEYDASMFKAKGIFLQKEKHSIGHTESNRQRTMTGLGMRPRKAFYWNLNRPKRGKHSYIR